MWVKFWVSKKVHFFASYSRKKFNSLRQRFQKLKSLSHCKSSILWVILKKRFIKRFNSIGHSSSSKKKVQFFESYSKRVQFFESYSKRVQFFESCFLKRVHLFESYILKKWKNLQVTLKKVSISLSHVEKKGSISMSHVEKKRSVMLKRRVQFCESYFSK